MRAVAAQARVGWCPGALRPMASGDGLIVRIKPRRGTITPEQGIGIAAAAVRFGNGALDLTSRANLQIRGVTDATLAGLTAALDRLGLLDASPEAEARRNVVTSPLAGLDPSAAFDIRPAVTALEERLGAETSLAGAPAKFGFAVSDGGALPLDGVSADVRFGASLDEDGRQVFDIRLDGGDGPIAVCAAPAMPEAAVRLARVFVGARNRDPELDRMRDLVARAGASAVFERAGLKIRQGAVGGGDLVSRDVAGPIVLRRPEDLPASGAPARWLAFGVAAPFGRLDAGQFDALARGAAASGALELRLTPWRAMLVPGIDPTLAAALADACVAAGLIIDPADPRLRVAACAGAPGCRRGTVPTLDHAARWARVVGPGRGIALHISGCQKGCAHSGPAPLTLVGRDGRYEVIVDGRPGEAPAALGLDPDEARRLIRFVLRRSEGP